MINYLILNKKKNVFEIKQYKYNRKINYVLLFGRTLHVILVVFC